MKYIKRDKLREEDIMMVRATNKKYKEKKIKCYQNRI